MNEEFIPENEKKFSLVREVYDWVESALTAVVCVVLVFTFVVRMVGVSGESMLPTLEDKDRLIATRLYDKPQYGDIVVVTKPNARDEPLIKRVIATEGQTIDISMEDGSVTVDGTVLDEDDYIYDRIEPDSIREGEYPVMVPQGCVFVMGDNRNHSWDSRDGGVGMVDEQHILGKVIYRLLPYDNMGRP